MNVGYSVALAFYELGRCIYPGEDGSRDEERELLEAVARERELELEDVRGAVMAAFSVWLVSTLVTGGLMVLALAGEQEIGLPLFTWLTVVAYAAFMSSVAMMMLCIIHEKMISLLEEKETEEGRVAVLLQYLALPWRHELWMSFMVGILVVMVTW